MILIFHNSSRKADTHLHIQLTSITAKEACLVKQEPIHDQMHV